MNLGYNNFTSAQFNNILNSVKMLPSSSSCNVSVGGVRAVTSNTSLAAKEDDVPRNFSSAVSLVERGRTANVKTPNYGFKPASYCMASGDDNSYLAEPKYLITPNSTRYS